MIDNLQINIILEFGTALFLAQLSGLTLPKVRIKIVFAFGIKG